jgi:hypothetical protein
VTDETRDVQAPVELVPDSPDTLLRLVKLLLRLPRQRPRFSHAIIGAEDSPTPLVKPLAVLKDDELAVEDRPAATETLEGAGGHQDSELVRCAAASQARPPNQEEIEARSSGGIKRTRNFTEVSAWTPEAFAGKRKTSARWSQPECHDSAVLS